MFIIHLIVAYLHAPHFSSVSFDDLQMSFDLVVQLVHRDGEQLLDERSCKPHLLVREVVKVVSEGEEHW